MIPRAKETKSFDFTHNPLQSSTKVTYFMSKDA